MPECPECGHRWSWRREKTLVSRHWTTPDGWRSLAIVVLPDRRPETGWMVNGILWRRVIHSGKVLGIYWCRFDLANHTPEELSETMYQRTGFMTVEKREELGIDDE